ncbi:acylneuraminate cytidylyltransferase family protein [Macrococcoides canis]|uniref:acylneuraminate cytidylyltransferase family protein n=1 Tax=Macrococcoides canis TaxID=1855823 RepID=UPI0020B6BE23|nr:acylneuraminate cytidylyltransferase family protein [Macrococcus canis]UTH00868.1 acylneuraminate cytidylyltransferase family protein [Macrococcus canis]UTH03233.1 acylneuraminate cytidylyltransferase family protein [Macrococcus canis]
MKKFTAIIPARSGSKGLPNKNIKIVDGKPLINYTVDAAINSKNISKVIVSSDSKEYLNLVTTNNKVLLHHRSSNLATDNTLTEEVIIDVIEKFNLQDDEYFILLQPTSPMRNNIHIDQSIEKLLKNDKSSLVSVTENSINSAIVNNLDVELSMENFIDTSKVNRRQEFKKEYYINGAIYISNIGEYLSTKSFYGKSSIAFIMDEKSSIDIDDELDLRFFEFLVDSEKQS